MSAPVLGYATNCYPGDSLEELMTSLGGEVAAVRELLGGDGPLALSVRISTRQARELASEPAKLDELGAALRNAGARVIGANAFPISAPKDGVYKDGIFAPDWRTDERPETTLAIARAVAGLIDEGDRGVLSAPTGTYRPWPGADSSDARKDCARRLKDCALELERISAETGRDIVLALEPEPYSTADTLSTILPYFRELLFVGESEAVARRRLGINLDLCHAAVLFEDAAENMRAYEREGISLFGVHVSAALRAPQPANRVEDLRKFDEPVYLHQVSALDETGTILFRWPDLRNFLRQPMKVLRRLSEARVHFHVPVFAERLGGLKTTSNLTWQAVRAARDEKLTDLFIVETYTWPQLEGTEGAAPSVAEGIARELKAAREVLGVG